MGREVVARCWFRRRRGRPLGRRGRGPDALLVGWDDVGAGLGCSPRQAQRYAELPSDPLPVWYLHEKGPPRILRSRLVAWRRRRLAGGRGERKVRRWAEICRRVELSRTAAWAAARWSHDPLPIERDAEDRPFAYVTALRDWKERRRRTFQQRREQRAIAVAFGPAEEPSTSAAPKNRARGGKVRTAA